MDAYRLSVTIAISIFILFGIRGLAAYTTTKPPCHCSDKSECTFESIFGPTGCSYCEKGWKGDYCDIEVEAVPISKILIFGLVSLCCLVLSGVSLACKFHLVEIRGKQQAEIRRRLIDNECAPEFTDTPPKSQNNDMQPVVGTFTSISETDRNEQSGSVRNSIDTDKVLVNVREVTLPSGQILYF